MQDVIKNNFSNHLEVINKVLETNISLIELFGNVLSRCLEKNGTIFLCGNGGSASDSQHIAAELVGRFKKDRRALKSIALTTDTSILTSVGNDYGFKEIFSRQIEALSSSGDILIGISHLGHVGTRWSYLYASGNNVWNMVGWSYLYATLPGKIQAK